MAARRSSRGRSGVDRFGRCHRACRHVRGGAAAHGSHILRNCAQAARPDGKVIIVEDTEHPEDTSTEMDLRMLAYCLGRERSIDGISGLAHEAGLTLGAVTHSRLRTIVELCRIRMRRKPIKDPPAVSDSRVRRVIPARA
ncbi:methyltransferase [Nocardia australiensis]|uniref:methyltransferase n=1 Tax=Nocardia australiensis TaxID=2887191 RepID=UPI001D1557D5